MSKRRELIKAGLSLSALGIGLSASARSVNSQTKPGGEGEVPTKLNHPPSIQYPLGIKRLL